MHKSAASWIMLERGYSGISTGSEQCRRGGSGIYMWQYVRPARNSIEQGGMASLSSRALKIGCLPLGPQNVAKQGVLVDSLCLHLADSSMAIFRNIALSAVMAAGARSQGGFVHFSTLDLQ